jgi:hypothetical protein
VIPTEHPAKSASTPKTGLFALLGAFLCLAGSGASAALPATASAYATTEGPPVYSTAPGLPDGRVYEQVSPANKNGNQAGAGTSVEGEDIDAHEHYAFAAPDGNSVLFEATGPIGETAAGYNLYFVASKNKSAPGWATHSVIPRSQQSAAQIGGTTDGALNSLDPSSDLSHVMFESYNGEFALDMPANFKECIFQWYLSGADPLLPATWLDRPETPGVCPYGVKNGAAAGTNVAGGTPNFSTVYFVSPGVLLPEDASRIEGEGFYEDSEGTLREAGVLPDGGLSPFGALPAAASPREGNGVSTDGSRAFFVSPDPATCQQNGGQHNCAVDPPELYVRENGASTVLVSRDTLLPAVGGLPAPAPADPEGSAESFLFASPDGSQVFFQSEAQLTSSAPEGPPGNVSPKIYDFDVDTGVLTYLPNVVGPILASSQDGSSFAFQRPAAGASAAELDLWSAGANGGSVTPIVQLPEAGASEARISSAGDVVVFLTSSHLSSAFNSGGAEQIYRYDVPSNTLACVSCTPHGVTPTGNAVMSQLQAFNHGSETEPRYPGLTISRGISSDGDRIFFDTPDPLVPQDTNAHSEGSVRAPYQTDNGDDVYEWENGVVYLISSGKSTHNAYYLESSENGDDVFFATTEGLVPGDTDGGYDVYDARIPHPGEPFPPPAVPCEGSVCQGPPNVPSPLTPPASATFSGLGNPTPEVTPPPVKKVTTKTVKCAKGKKLSHGKCVKVKNKKKKAKKASNDRRAGR